MPVLAWASMANSLALAAVPYTESVAEIVCPDDLLDGLVPLEHEYKLMGMAPYASPSRSQHVYQQLASLMAFDGKGAMTWHRQPGVPPMSIAHRYLENLYHLQRFDNICGGIQKVYRGVPETMGA